jgi:hypothetical protein
MRPLVGGKLLKVMRRARCRAAVAERRQCRLYPVATTQRMPDMFLSASVPGEIGSGAGSPLSPYPRAARLTR